MLQLYQTSRGKLEEKRTIFREEPCGDMENPVRDEKGRHDIDRVVQMSQQYDRSHKNRPREKNISKICLALEYKSQEKRYACVGRKEQIATE